jgi:hypothetical protein
MNRTARRFSTIGLIAFLGGSAAAALQPTTLCGIAKLKCAIGKLRRDLACERKAAKLGVPVDTTCLAKAQSKFSGSVTSCMERADVKFGTSCVANADAAALGGDVDAFVADVKAMLYANPAPTAPNGCVARQYKCLRPFANGLVGCDVSALKLGGFVAQSCLDARLAKFSGDADACMDKADATCAGFGVGVTGQAPTIRDRTLAFVDTIECQQTPAGVTFDVTTQAGPGFCGTTDGTVDPLLSCGRTYFGGGNAVFVTSTPFAAGQVTHFDVAGGKERLCPRSAAATGSDRTCSATGCLFGPPVPMMLGGISSCAVNTFAADAHGEIVPNSGAMTGDIPLVSTLTITGNAAEPCPKCVGGACDATALNAGAACTSDASTGESHDCTAAGLVMPPQPLDLRRTTTGTSSMSGPGGLFCPSQLNAGAFGDAAVTTIEEIGDSFGNLHGGPPGNGTLALVFCMPAIGNLLLDGALDLPGPAAMSLPLSGSLN